MTTEIRTLRVSAGMDVSDYQSGAAKKVAADKAMVAAAREVSVTITQQDQKISESASVISKLSRQFVDGYASAQRFESGIRQLNSQLEAGKTDAASAAIVYQGMVQKLGLVANGAEIATQGYRELGAVIDSVNGKMQRTPQNRPVVPAAAVNDNMAQGRRQNLGYQAFDIGQGLAQGMPVGMIAAQQLPQIAQLYAGQGGVKAALSDVATLATGAAAAIGPIGIALGVTGAAAFAYYQLTKTESKTTDELLKAHHASIKLVGDLWSDAAEQRSKYGRVSTDVVTLGLDNSIADMTKRLRENVSSGDIGAGVLSSINRNMDATGLSAGEFRQSTIFKTLQVDFDALHKATLNGRPDVLGLIGRLQDIRRGSENSGIRKMADDAVEALQPYKDLAEALREADMARRRLFEDRGENGRLLSRGTTNTRDMSSYAGFSAGQEVAARRSQQSYDAQIAGINARSPEERAAAARQSAAAQYNNDETPAVRRMRIEQAGTLALAQAEKTLNDAREARARNLDKSVADQQLEISLIGKTAGEAAGLRREYELISQLKEEARQNGISVDQKEIDRIKETTAELSKMADVLARAKMGDDLKFERSQLGRSDVDQQIATRQRGAGLPVDLNSSEADQMREIERAKELRAQGKGFVTDLVSGLRDGEKIGEAFGNAILNGLARASEKQLDKLVDSFMSWLFPVNGGSPASSAAPGIVGSVLGAANDNTPTGMASVGAVTRVALPAVGATKTGIPLSEITAAGGLTAKVSSEYAPRFQGLLNDLDKAGYPIKSLGEGGYSYRKVAGTNNLSKHSFGEALDINPRQNPWSHKFQTDLPANVNDIAKQNGLTWGGTWNKPDTMHFQVDKTANTASAALDKLASNAGAATDGLGQLGGGLTKIGQGLSTSFFPAAPAATGGGGGFGSWLSGLFGGGLSPSTIAKYTPLTGLFADGTDSAPGGVAMVGERGRELVNLPRGSQVVPNHKTEAMLNRAANSNGGNYQPSKVDLHVTVIGGSGDEHVKKLARQGAQQALSEDKERQRRGGFGEMNNRFASQKG